VRPLTTARPAPTDITSVSQPFFIGSGLIVKIFADGVEVGSGTVDGGENYSIQTSVLTPATYTMTATLTDAAADNESAPSVGLSVTIL